MPYINIKITREGTTAEQKAELIKGATELLARVLNKNPKTTVVTIEEVDTDSWGYRRRSRRNCKRKRKTPRGGNRKTET